MLCSLVTVFNKYFINLCLTSFYWTSHHAQSHPAPPTTTSKLSTCGKHCTDIAWMPAELNPIHKIRGREVRSGLAPLRSNYCPNRICSDQSDGRTDDQQKQNQPRHQRTLGLNLLRCVDSTIASVTEDIDSALILKGEQRTAITAFVDRKDVFAVLPTGFGKSQLAPMVAKKIGCGTLHTPLLWLVVGLSNCVQSGYET